MHAPCSCATSTPPYRYGTFSRVEPCGCEIRGFGLQANPWHIHYCPMHAEVTTLAEDLAPRRSEAPRPAPHDLALGAMGLISLAF
jgi:hypothetical protein